MAYNIQPDGVLTHTADDGVIMEMIAEKSRMAYSASGLLGIPSSSNLGLAKKVESGLTFSALEKLSKATGLSIELLRIAVRITPRTMTRRRSENRLSPEESDRLVSVSRLMAMTFELFEGNKARALKWFTSPKRALGGRSPLETASTEVGSREVENLIGRLEHGVFS